MRMLSDLFERQFIAAAGGYLFYPSARAMGKLITVAERDALVAGYRRAVSWRRLLGLSAFLFLGIIAVNIAGFSSAFVGISPFVIMALLTIWFLWASYAPHRLVKARPAVAPARSWAEVKRQGREMMSWGSILANLVMSAALVIFGLASAQTSLARSAMLVGGSAMFCTSLWNAYRKYADQKAEIGKGA